MNGMTAKMNESARLPGARYHQNGPNPKPNMKGAGA